MTTRSSSSIIAASNSLKLPSRLGCYDVLGRLGEGAMGEVFLANHPLLDRKVAIKRFRPSINVDRDPRERFLREGRALASLDHPAVVTVHDFIEWNKDLLLVMELVEGVTLDKVISLGPLPADVVASIALELAGALDAAHRIGLVHRDVKPSNVMLSFDGFVKLMDFGIARNVELDELTRTGLVVGTPMYVSPEVLNGESAGPASDLYALGVLMYTMISGRRPFDKATSNSLPALIIGGFYPKLRSIAPKAPRAIRVLIERLMSKHPTERYASAAELRQSLDLFLASIGAYTNHAARIEGFLVARGLSDPSPERTDWLDASGLVVSSQIVRVRRRLSFRKFRWGFAVVAVVVVFFSAAVVATSSIGLLQALTYGAIP